MSDTPRLAACPVCRFSLPQPFFSGGLQPLATLGWPASAEEAQAMPRFPLDFVQCPRCSHVWNRAFAEDEIPYQKNPNRMFNSGGIWQGHLAATRDQLLAKLPARPTVIDIGCGEGHFIRGLAQSLEGQGRFIGFDPNSSPETGVGVEFHASYFEPLRDMAALRPDAITFRHVLEHLSDPLAFIERLAWAAQQLDKPVWLFAETPCIDKVFPTGRLADFFYEHVSHFTTLSFARLMQAAGSEAPPAHGYDGEVVYAICPLRLPESTVALARSALAFHQQAERSQAALREQLDALANAGKQVAIWGGTGKAAAFMHQFGADARRFPLVVDSDPGKVGSFVPGTGQRIEFRDRLKAEPVDVVIIPTQWRAKDIWAEMQREGIVAEQVLIEHEGRLVDFHRDPHPYRSEASPRGVDRP